MALGLEGTPWYVADVRFDREQKRLDIDLDFSPGTRFTHPESGASSPVYDTQPRTWRHLNFFQFECYVHAPVPRVDGGDSGGVKQVGVPWARPQSGFTLLMEAMMVLSAQTGMTAAEVGELLGEYPQRVWNVLLHHVEGAHKKLKLDGLEVVSVDEVSRRRGHDYLTIISEPKRPGQKARVLLVFEGRESGTLGQFRDYLVRQGVELEQVQTICSDMSPAYIKGIREQFPKAKLVFDYFHVIAAVSAAVDRVRRRERHEFPEELKGKRWILLKGDEKLTEAERKERRVLCSGKLQTGKAFNHLDALRDIMRQNNPKAAEKDLKWWCGWVSRSRIPEMAKACKTIRDHWDGIVEYLKTRVTNGAAEALNGIIQTVNRKSRGFRTVEYFRAMIYLVASHLQFDLPDPVPGAHRNSY